MRLFLVVCFLLVFICPSVWCLPGRLGSLIQKTAQVQDALGQECSASAERAKLGVHTGYFSERLVRDEWGVVRKCLQDICKENGCDSHTPAPIGSLLPACNITAEESGIVSEILQQTVKSSDISPFNDCLTGFITLRTAVQAFEGNAFFEESLALAARNAAFFVKEQREKLGVKEEEGGKERHARGPLDVFATEFVYVTQSTWAGVARAGWPVLDMWGHMWHRIDTATREQKQTNTHTTHTCRYTHTRKKNKCTQVYAFV
eukprot:GDKI01025950.1.p2 GENE.GDKI01025950.1~~GDKI01025950.1.p2  ORF type:complete len:260 (-),score=33.00 GDKI01025950.1:56-835(-)